nr:MAG: zinc ABC transporter substrate-binding protein [Pseudomonadota bacterium]
MLTNSLSQFATAILALLLPCAALADVRVVVTSKPIHSLVSSVMAGIGEPDLLVDGAASPHSYAMRPSDARKVQNAQIVFRVSEEFEPFTAKLAATLPNSVRVVSLIEAPGLNRLPIRQGGAFEEDDHERSRGQHGNHQKADDHEHATYDPHVWLDPENAKAMVSHIADVLARLTPENAAILRANADAEIARISALSEELQGELASVSARPFLVHHDAIQYFEKRFGLNAAGSVTLSPDVPPSGKRLQQLRQILVSSGVVCVFIEPYGSPRVAEVLVEGTSTRIGTFDPEGRKLTPGPDLYHSLMRNLASDLKSCLAGS